MHLAIISPYPPAITGIGQYGYHVVNLLARCGGFSRLSLLTGHTHLSHNGHSHPTVEIRRLWLPDQWSVARSIPASIQQIQPDLVWFNLGASVFGRYPPANLGGYLSVSQVRRLGYPTVVTLHELPELSDLRTLRAPGGALGKYGARLLTYLATRADVTCLTTQKYSEWLASRYAERTFLHIPLGAYKMPAMPEEPDAPELLFFSSIAPFKGLEVLLEAFRSLKVIYPALRLTVAGAEHIRFPGYFQHVCQKYADLRDVNWLGQVPEEQVGELFRCTQLVVLPYLASTGSTSVLMQAAMRGRAIVVSGLPEIRSLGREMGFEVEYFLPGDVSSLVEAIRFQIENPERRQTQIRQNLNSLQHHLPQDTCHAYLAAFNLALENRRSLKRIPLPVNSAVEPT